MSFILDALKKSEADRQHQASAEFANVPTSDATPRAPRWLWVFGALLAINLLVLLGLFLRPDDPPTAVVTADQQAQPLPRDNVQANAAIDSFAAQVRQAERNQPEPQAGASSEPGVTATESVDANNEPRMPRASGGMSDTERARLPTVQEVIVNGTLDIPDLHLDIHVYSDSPEERFVFINMSKQREKSQLLEGPTVEEITPDGVVLEYRGTSFMLRRD
jgi:general secretion pathway protein B